jgi:hypothetical protein
VRGWWPDDRSEKRLAPGSLVSTPHTRRRGGRKGWDPPALDSRPGGPETAGVSGADENPDGGAQESREHGLWPHGYTESPAASVVRRDEAVQRPPG